MKRLIAAGILLVLVITSYILSFFYIKNTCAEIKDMVIKCEQEYENDIEKCYETSKELQDIWSKKEMILSFFVNHDRVDEVELAISSLKVYSNKPNNDIFYEYSGQIKMLLHQLKEDSEISTHSIF